MPEGGETVHDTECGNGGGAVRSVVMKINQAVIIAGGMGTRLKPFTDTAPKPMYPFEGVPFIEYLVKQVKSFGIDRILILLGYLQI